MFIWSGVGRKFIVNAKLSETHNNKLSGLHMDRAAHIHTKQTCHTL